jgi:hypothetical protein
MDTLSLDTIGNDVIECIINFLHISDLFVLAHVSRVFRVIGQKYQNVKFDSKYAARTNNIELLKWAISNEYYNNKQGCKGVASIGKISTFEYLLRRKFRVNNSAYCYAIKYSKYNNLQWLLYSFSTYSFKIFIYMAKYEISEKVLDYTKTFLTNTTKNKKLPNPLFKKVNKFLKYVIKNNKIGIMVIAMDLFRIPYISPLKYMVKYNNFSYYEELWQNTDGTFIPEDYYYLAKAGKLDVYAELFYANKNENESMQYLIYYTKPSFWITLENFNCVSDKSVKYAIQSGSTKKLKYLLDNGGIITKKMWLLIPYIKSVNMMRILFKHEKEISKKTVDLAMMTSNIEALKWLNKKGLNINYKLIDYVIEICDDEMVQYIYDQVISKNSELLNKTLKNDSISYEFIKILCKTQSYFTKEFIDNALLSDEDKILRIIFESGATEKITDGVFNLELAIANNSILYKFVRQNNIPYDIDKLIDFLIKDKKSEYLSTVIRDGYLITDDFIKKICSNIYDMSLIFYLIRYAEYQHFKFSVELFEIIVSSCKLRINMNSFRINSALCDVDAYAVLVNYFLQEYRYKISENVMKMTIRNNRDMTFLCLIEIYIGDNIFTKEDLVSALKNNFSKPSIKYILKHLKQNVVLDQDLFTYINPTDHTMKKIVELITSAGVSINSVAINILIPVLNNDLCDLYLACPDHTNNDTQKYLIYNKKFNVSKFLHDNNIRKITLSDFHDAFFDLESDINTLGNISEFMNALVNENILNINDFEMDDYIILYYDDEEKIEEYVLKNTFSKTQLERIRKYSNIYINTTDSEEEVAEAEYINKTCKRLVQLYMSYCVSKKIEEKNKINMKYVNSI